MFVFWLGNWTTSAAWVLISLWCPGNRSLIFLLITLQVKRSKMSSGSTTSTYGCIIVSPEHINVSRARSWSITSVWGMCSCVRLNDFIQYLYFTMQNIRNRFVFVMSVCQVSKSTENSKTGGSTDNTIECSSATKSALYLSDHFTMYFWCIHCFCAVGFLDLVLL